MNRYLVKTTPRNFLFSYPMFIDEINKLKKVEHIIKMKEYEYHIEKVQEMILKKHGFDKEIIISKEYSFLFDMTTKLILPCTTYVNHAYTHDVKKNFILGFSAPEEFDVESFQKRLSQFQPLKKKRKKTLEIDGLQIAERDVVSNDLFSTDYFIEFEKRHTANGISVCH